ncbi:MAG: isoleucine--tRNA ligase [Elusimicrobia bacterium]|nr:isoleucine--tRNA ligase [Elusimicrobiota bacterium]
MNNSSETTKNSEYSATVLLPKTSFPMRGELPKREPETIKFWESINLYKAMLDKRKDRRPYILHDGPPYANGELHMGHTLNKTLKDITVKSRAMLGFYTPFVPGWDCHGLPIELALLKKLKLDKRHISDVPAFRRQAREFAQQYIDIQREGFKRHGIQADWDNPYITMSPQFEGTVVKAFLDLVRKGYINKGKKTIYWCVNCETALADAEVEYADKNSTSIFVAFELADKPRELFGEAANGKVSIVIWTTTPWTLPSNMAAAVAKDENYRILKDSATGACYVAADKLADALMEQCKLKCEKLGLITGEKLVGLKYRHPLFEDKINTVIHTDFVAMDTGSGIVHIAPGHGEDDFHAGLAWKLDIFCPVNERGVFTKEGRQFEGLSVWQANSKVIETLAESGKLLAQAEIRHSYPHCWRCHKPVIFRATEQWFLGVDKHGLREKLLSEIDKVRFVPQGGHERIGSMVRNRPDWCLSRQRHWGTPVPMITCKTCGAAQTDETVFSAIEKRAFAEGTDFWFSDPVEKILPPGHKCKCGSSDFRKETDVLDVWLDSGVSWMAVLKSGQGNNGTPLYPAQLYLEGSDQHRGWFQSSLIPSVALEGRAPYETVLTHGFLLDGEGKAMHKSAGNAISPQEVIKKYGAEVLRLWVALGDYSEDVRISDKLLEGPIDTYRKMRNTVRYLLGNLWDYNPKLHAVPDDKLPEMDRYMKHRLAQTVAQARRDYEQFRYRSATRTVADFCILDLSAFYLDALKDRLYTLGAQSHERRSAQTVLFEITVALLKLMAPVVSFTAEEAWQELRKFNPEAFEKSVFLEDFPPENGYEVSAEISERWTKIRQLREQALKALEEARQKGTIGSSLEAKVTFRPATPELQEFFRQTEQFWPAVLIVSQASVEPAPQGGPELDISVSHADGAKCPRCWQWRTDIGKDNGHPDICSRCAKALGH